MTLRYTEAFTRSVCPTPTLNVWAKEPLAVNETPKLTLLFGLLVNETAGVINPFSKPGSYQVSPSSMLYQSPSSVAANKTWSDVIELVKTFKSYTA